MKNLIEINPSTQFEVLITELTYIRSQNETILQNQSLDIFPIKWFKNCYL